MVGTRREGANEENCLLWEAVSPQPGSQAAWSTTTTPTSMATKMTTATTLNDNGNNQ